MPPYYAPLKQQKNLQKPLVFHCFTAEKWEHWHEMGYRKMKPTLALEKPKHLKW